MSGHHFPEHQTEPDPQVCRVKFQQRYQKSHRPVILSLLSVHLDADLLDSLLIRHLDKDCGRWNKKARGSYVQALVQYLGHQYSI